MNETATTANLDRLLHHGVALHQQGSLTEAETIYRQIIALHPTNHDALHLLGLVRCALGDAADGIALIEHAVALNPGFVGALCNLAIELNRAGRVTEALTRFAQTLALAPNHLPALMGHGMALQAMGRTQEAIDLYTAAFNVDPTLAEASMRRGDALWELDRLPEAEADLTRAVSLDPSNPIAWLVFGNVLLDRERFETAVECYDRALALAPDLLAGWMNRGTALQAAGRIDEALAGYDRILRVQPDHADARFNQGLCHLRLGRFEQGWAGYEWRWKLPARQGAFDGFGRPLWDGRTDLTGKRILLHGEQGLGDTIQFCRFAAKVAERGATVILGVQPPLKSWLTTLSGSAQVLAAGDPRPAFDLHCPLMSLPAILGLGADDLATDGPYLPVDPVHASGWRARLTPLPGLRVGIAWAGDARRYDRTAFRMDRRRSIPLPILADLADMADMAGVTFVSLQKGEAGASAATVWPGLIDWTEHLRDFTDTAALISALDLVVTVDTSIAHVAGAVGARVWVLNRFDRCWRWGLTGAETTWYPTMRLFTQPHPGHWMPVVDEIKTALRHHVAKHDAISPDHGP